MTPFCRASRDDATQRVATSSVLVRLSCHARRVGPVLGYAAPLAWRSTQACDVDVHDAAH
jgi:hypothetical protein